YRKCLHTICRWRRVWFWRRGRHRHGPPACARTHWGRTTHQLQIHRHRQRHGARLMRSPHLLSGPAFRGLRIGILGGSFNPAHAGHLHISLFALKAMGLNAVWWLVSPQNPLKSERGMASFEERLRDAQKLAAAHPQIIVSDLEARLGTRFTADT